MAGFAAELPRARMPVAALRLLGDDRLFRLAAGGDAHAFEAIYERHHQALYRYCRSIVGNGDDAADALQSTMASALRGIAGERRKIPLKPWLFRIAHNECVSLLRKRRAHVAIDQALGLEAPADDPVVRQRLQELVADLRELPDAQRGALVMHELSGLRYRDIAAALDTTEAHVRQLAYEARAALHDLAEGRVMECDEVRRAISDADGRVMRGRRIRAHLRACSGCDGFRRRIGGRRRDLAAVASPIPAAMAAGLLHKLVGGSSSGASAAASAGGAGGGSVGSLIVGKAVVGSMAVKVAAAVALAAATGAGALEVAGHGSHAAAPARSAAARQAAASAGPALAEPRPVTTAAPAGAHGPGEHRLVGHHRPARSRARGNAGHRHFRSVSHHARPLPRRGLSQLHRPSKPRHLASPPPTHVPTGKPAPKARHTPAPKQAPAPNAEHPDAGSPPRPHGVPAPAGGASAQGAHGHSV